MSNPNQNPNGLPIWKKPVRGNAAGDPHYVNFAGQSYDAFPVGDAVILDGGDMIVIHGRHAGEASVTTAIAFKSSLSPYVLEYYCDKKTLWIKSLPDPERDPVELESPGIFLPPNISIKGNKESFEIEFHDIATKVGVQNAGGYYLNFSVETPKKIAKKCKPSLLGNLYGDHGQIIQASGLFHETQIARPSSIHKNPPQVNLQEMLQDRNFATIVQGIQDENKVRDLAFDYKFLPERMKDTVQTYSVSFVKEQTIKEGENIKDRFKELNERYDKLNKLLRVLDNRISEVDWCYTVTEVKKRIQKQRQRQ